MKLSDFYKTELNGHEVYKNDFFMLVKSNVGTWNAYKVERDSNGITMPYYATVNKILIRQDRDDEGNLQDVYGAQVYITPEDAAADCII